MTKKTMQFQNQLEKFQSFEKIHPGKIPFSVHFDFKKHAGHVVFAALVHGNEVGPLDAITKCMELLIQNKISYGGKVTFVLGNTAAAQKNVRFIESDLNRSFGYGDAQTETLERKRSVEIMSLIETCDVFFDFHQTIMPSLHPFYIFPMNPKSYLWARAAGSVSKFVTRKEGVSFSAAGQCSDEFARSLNKIGVTVELGEQGFHKECTLLTTQIIKRTLFNMDCVHLKNRNIETLAHKNEDFEFLTISHREPFNHSLKRLNEGFCNFNKVTTGMVLGADEFGNPLEAKCDGYILFPKYPVRNEKNEVVGPRPGELFLIAGCAKNF